MPDQAPSQKLCGRHICGDVAYGRSQSESDYKQLESPVVSVVRTVLGGDHDCSVSQ